MEHNTAITSHVYDPTSLAATDMLHRIRKQFTGDLIYSSASISGHFAMTDFSGIFRDKLGVELRMWMTGRGSVVLYNDSVIISISDRNGIDQPWVNRDRVMGIVAEGRLDLVKTVMEFATNYPITNEPRIIWKFMSDKGVTDAIVEIENPKLFPPSFYPFLPSQPDDFMQEFLDSHVSFMLLRGEPGTGKTSFIRRMINHAKSECVLTFDEKLLYTDTLFVQFMLSESNRLLVIEDADNMLSARDKGHNNFMAKLLNLSDGLIRIPKKKIVITTNLIEERHMDSALLRPGRMFHTPIFRKLTYQEAKIAAEDAGVILPSEERDYSLAEIINQQAETKRRSGFLAAA
jgi:hypothetical protein